MSVLYFSMLLFGFLAGLLLFIKVPKLPKNGTKGGPVKVTVIIPARNEEENIGRLLEDLLRQGQPVHQIICVDDGSSDGTAQRIQSFEVDYLYVAQKPQGWMGKTHACQLGADHATGDVLVFVDADVRLGGETVQRIAEQCGERIVSVQPYHNVTHFYEHFALFFNAVGVGANGVACPLSEKKAGLFGPVIAMTREQFAQIGGYSQVKDSVIEDVELGRVIEEHGLYYRLFVGDEALAFRMYQSFKELFLGFTKNYSSGAARTPFLLLLFTFGWLTALTATPMALVQGLLQQNLTQTAVAAALYLAFVAQLMGLARKIGSFKKGYIAIYPLFLAVFHGVFFYSLYSKLFRKKVFWKGREVSLKK